MTLGFTLPYVTLVRYASMMYNVVTNVMMHILYIYLLQHEEYMLYMYVLQ